MNDATHIRRLLESLDHEEPMNEMPRRADIPHNMKFVKVYIPKGQKINDRQLADKVVNRAQKIAEKDGVAFPKRPSVFGSYGDHFVIQYRSNTVRDVILTACEKLGLDYATTTQKK
jgi:hypothetical protein